TPAPIGGALALPRGMGASPMPRCSLTKRTHGVAAIEMQNEATAREVGCAKRSHRSRTACKHLQHRELEHMFSVLSSRGGSADEGSREAAPGSISRSFGSLPLPSG